MTQLETVLEQMLQQIDHLEKRIDDLKSAEYSRFNVLYLTDGVTAPGTAAGWALLYVDTSTGDLMVKFGDGTTKTLATD